jgi:receptor expression-enhancing protein 5/6
MDQVKQKLSEKTAILDGYARMIPPVEDAARKVGVNPGLILGALLFVVGVFALLFQGFAICVTMFTVIYPGLLSIRAIETSSADDDKIWLTYWIVFGFLEVAETFFGFVFYFVPYYSYIRVALFVWLIQFNGAETLYSTVLRDLLRKNKDLIQSFIKRAQDTTESVAKKAATDLSDPNILLKAAQVATNV